MFDRRAAAASPRKLWCFRIAALALSALVCFGLYAVYRRAVRDRPIYLQEPGHERTGHRYLYDPWLGWRNIPDWRATTNGRPLSINSRGLRDREYDYAKPERIRRILVLGDSFTWGYGVSDKEVFTEFLERRLHDKPLHEGDDYQVINTGVSGWGTDQEFLFLTREGFRYEPDVVVLAFFIVNDVENNAASVAYGLQKPVFLDEQLEAANVPVPKPAETADKIRTRIDPMRLTLAIIERMDEECRRRDCRLVVAKFGRFLPHWKDKKEMLDREEQLETALRRRPEISYLDLDEAFDAAGITAGEILRGNDDGHWNAHGHEHVAGFLYKHFRESKLPGVE